MGLSNESANAFNINYENLLEPPPKPTHLFNEISLLNFGIPRQHQQNGERGNKARVQGWKRKAREHKGTVGTHQNCTGEKRRGDIVCSKLEEEEGNQSITKKLKLIHEAPGDQSSPRNEGSILGSEERTLRRSMPAMEKF
ncbi:hypothetical protein U1Q18_016429 [Sarracenia purpurea var. burkii]